jgi:hypothetical protein
MIKPVTPIVKNSVFFSLFHYTDLHLPFVSKRVISNNRYWVCHHHNHCPEEFLHILGEFNFKLTVYNKDVSWLKLMHCIFFLWIVGYTWLKPKQVKFLNCIVHVCMFISPNNHLCSLNTSVNQRSKSFLIPSRYKCVWWRSCNLTASLTSSSDA